MPRLLFSTALLLCSARHQIPASASPAAGPSPGAMPDWSAHPCGTSGFPPAPNTPLGQEERIPVIVRPRKRFRAGCVVRSPIAQLAALVAAVLKLLLCSACLVGWSRSCFCSCFSPRIHRGTEVGWQFARARCPCPNRPPACVVALLVGAPWRITKLKEGVANPASFKLAARSSRVGGSNHDSFVGRPGCSPCAHVLDGDSAACKPLLIPQGVRAVV